MSSVSSIEKKIGYNVTWNLAKDYYIYYKKHLHVVHCLLITLDKKKK